MNNSWSIIGTISELREKETPQKTYLIEVATIAERRILFQVAPVTLLENEEDNEIRAISQEISCYICIM